MAKNSHPAGSLFGAILLIAGCCIGAGMLGLPVQSGLAGFIPSTTMLFFSWLFMLTTGLLLLEVNLWFADEVSFVTLAGKTLGTVGKAASWILFMFLFYCIIVAYIAGSGGLIADFISTITATPIPQWVGSTICVVVFGFIVYLGTAAVDHSNRILMLGLGITFLLLIAIGLPYVEPAFLTHQDWKVAPLVIPALIISFGFHNLIPTLVTYLNHNVKKLRLAILIGSLIPFAVYFIWEFVILGIIPFNEQNNFQQAIAEGGMVTQALHIAGGPEWVITLTHYFAFFIIVTSFLGVSLSFVDFLADGLNLQKKGWNTLLLCLLVFVPPFLFAISYPNIFLSALNYAGSFGAVTLFGILPALMAWRGRYSEKMDHRQLVPGGKLVLSLIILCAIAIVVLQVYHDWSFSNVG
jgi:tyrosine-specific transport protein